MATANLPAPPKTITEYVQSIVESDPQTALQIALAETERQRLALQRVQDQLRAEVERNKKMANVELDDKGQYVVRSLSGLIAIGDMYAYSGLVPKHYEEKPGACAIAVQMAMRCGVDTFLFMQNTYPVGNKIGMEAKLAIALLNSSGRIKDRITWRFSGEGKERACTAIVVDKFTGQVIEQTVDWDMVEAEGWHKPKGSQVSKWMTMPDVMFQYRSAAFLARIHYPDVLMGMYTMDELDDINEQRKVVIDAKPIKTLNDLTDRITGPAEPETQEQAAGEPEAETTAQQSPDNETLPSKPLEGLYERLKSARNLAQVGEIEADIAATYKLTPEQEAALAEDCEARREQIRAEKGK